MFSVKIRSKIVILLILALSILQTKSATAETPGAVIAALSYPPLVLPGRQFFLNVTILYDVQAWMISEIGIFDPNEMKIVSSQRIYVPKSQLTEISLPVEAPSTEGSWRLNVYVRLWNVNVWIISDGGRRDISMRIRNESEITLTIGIGNIAVKLDGRDLVADATGTLRYPLQLGRHVLVVPKYVQTKEDERYVFRNWENGQTNNRRSLDVAGEARITAKYGRELFVVPADNSHHMYGTGWRPTRDQERIVADDPLIPNSPLGILGQRIRFAGFGTSDMSQNREGQRTLEPIWLDDYTPLFLPAISLIVLGISYGVRRMRGRAMMLSLIVLLGSMITDVAARPVDVRVGDGTWYYFGKNSSDTCLLWLGGGRVTASEITINPYELESFNTIRYLQDLSQYYRLLALKAGPAEGHAIAYSDRATLIDDFITYSINMGCRYRFLLGFSTGGLIAAAELWKDPQRWSGPNGAVIISTPLTYVEGRSGLNPRAIPASVLFLYAELLSGGERDDSLWPQGLNFYRGMNQSLAGRVLEWSLMKGVNHEVWTSEPSGGYNASAASLTISFIEKSKAAGISHDIVRNLPKCSNEGTFSLNGPNRALAKTVTTIVARIGTASLIGRANLTLFDAKTGEVLSSLTSTRVTESLILPIVFRGGGARIVIGVLDSQDCRFTSNQLQIIVTTLPLLEVKLPRDGISIDLDGKPAVSDARGLVSLEARPGEHVVRLPLVVPRGSGERLVFSAWADGYDGNARSFVVGSYTRLEAIYLIEYLVQGEASGGVTYGSGWYLENSTAILESAPVYVPMKGLLGRLGLRLHFAGWEGWPNGSRIIAFKVSNPKTLKATWNLDPLSLIPLLVTAALASASFLLWMTKNSGDQRRPVSDHKFDLDDR